MPGPVPAPIPEPVPLPTPPPRPDPWESGSEGGPSGSPAANRVPAESGLASSRTSCGGGGTTSMRSEGTDRLRTATVTRSRPVACAVDGGVGCRLPPPPPPPPGAGLWKNTSRGSCSGWWALLAVDDAAGSGRGHAPTRSAATATWNKAETAPPVRLARRGILGDGSTRRSIELPCGQRRYWCSRASARASLAARASSFASLSHCAAAGSLVRLCTRYMRAIARCSFMSTSACAASLR